MTTIHISYELADKLNRLAEREHKSVDEVLEKLLEAEIVEKSTSEDEDLPGGTALLRAIRTANINSGTTDTTP